MSSLIKTMGVYDFNLKLVLERVNAVYHYIEQLKVEYSQTPDQQSQDQQIIATSEYVIPISNVPTPDRRMGRVEAAIQIPTQPDTVVRVPAQQPNKQTMPVQVPQDSSKKTNVPVSPDKKVPVVQQLKYNTGGDVFMADVSIADKNNELVHKCKTNAMGKWQAYLKPGKYYVSVMKTDTTTKSKTEALQEITIPNSESTVNLPPAMIKKG